MTRRRWSLATTLTGVLAPEHRKPRPRNRRRWILVGVAATILAAGPVTATTAQADGLDDLCKTVPSPVRPDYQVSGLVMDKPDIHTVPDSAPDPFKDTSVPISDVYGWAWRFTNYDLGCGNDFIRDPTAVTTTTSANFVVAWMNTLNSAVASIEHMAHTATLDWLQKVVVAIANTLATRVLTVWLPLAALLLAVIVAGTAHKAGYADTLRRLATLAAAIVVAVLTLVLPRQTIALTGQAVDTAAGAAQAGFSTDAADLVTREALYKTWLVGNFGSADSPTAMEYGPRLMSALTYTWSDVKRMDAEPGAKTTIDDAKATAYKTIAAEIQEKDPAAYESLTGKTDTRTAPATFGIAWLVLMGLFVAIACFIVVLAKVLMLGLILYGMVASVVGVIKFSALQRVWDLFTAALLNVVKFTITAGAMTLAMGAISTAPVGAGWRLLFAAILTAIALMFTKPVRSFKSMAGMNPNSSVITDMTRRAIGTAIGNVVGSKIGNSQKLPDTTPEETEGTPAEHAAPVSTPAPVEPSYPPLPPPPMIRALPAGANHKYAANDPQPHVTGWGGYTDIGNRLHPSPLARPIIPAPEPTPMALPPGHQIQVPPARTTISPITGAGAVPTYRTPTAAATESTTATGSDAAVEPGLTLTSIDASLRSGTAMSPPFTIASPPARTPSEPPPSTLESPVVYPVGIIIQEQDSSLYRSSGNTSAGVGELYCQLPEPQIDADGHETWEPTYQAKQPGTV